MNIIQEQINKNSSKQTRTNYCAVEEMVMGPPRIPHRNMHTPAVTPAHMRALTSMGSSSSKAQSSSTRPTDERRFILALCEGRGQARGVVGLAAIDINKPTLILSQIADVQNYTYTITKMNVLRPVNIIVPSTFVECVPENRLLTTVRERSRAASITSVSRTDFNINRGLSHVRLLCATAYESVLLTLKHKAYAAAAAAALLRYVEQVHHIVYCSQSIRVELQEPEDLTVIDIDTVDKLELVMSRANSDITLLSVLDHCVTPGGKRLLRANILQPPWKQGIVESRLDCVSELLENKNLLRSLRDALTALSDVEQSIMLGSLMSHPLSTTGLIERQLNYVLSLRSSLVAAVTLYDVLASAKHPVLRSIHAQLAEVPQEVLLKLIGNLINDDAHPARGSNGDMNRCFAIRAGLSDLLDIARKTYTEKIDDMRSYVDDLAEQCSLPLRLLYNSKRGFHITMKVMKQQRNITLPFQFVQVERGQTNITMTTSDLVNYGLQLRLLSEEIMSLSKSLLHELLLKIHPHIALLYRLCDDVAFLDTLQSLTVASAVNGFVRPRFNEFMRVTAGKHPLLERPCHGGLVSNSALAQSKRNFHIITGPNMSGKSVYIRQIVLIQIMAQVGCFIPAESATFRLCDRVHAIIGREDCIESGASSFVKEMREVRYLFDMLTDNSLVVMDELCRATSCDEGVSIARAICEKLLHTRAFTFISTHYLSLSTLAEEYANVTNWHMETFERKINSSNDVRLIFTHCLKRGVTPIRQYGLKFARVCGSTKFVAERAAHFLDVLLPSTSDERLTEDCKQKVSFLLHELEADLELLELENKCTPELRQKMISDFEKKTGQLYQPSIPESIPQKDSSSISSKKIERLIIDDNSSASSDNEQDEIRKDGTNDSYSEMDVDISNSESCDPLGNILKCRNGKDDGSSEWALSNRNTKSKSSKLSPLPRDPSIPMCLVAATYSFDEDMTFNSSSSQSEEYVNTNKFNLLFQPNKHKTSTFGVESQKLFENMSHSPLFKFVSQKNNDYIGSNKNMEKVSCFTGDINSSLSKPNSRPDRLKNIQTLNKVNSSCVSKNFLNLNYNDTNNSPVSSELSYLHDKDRQCKIDTTQNNSVYLSRPSFIEFGLEKNIENIGSDRNIEKDSCFAGDISSSISKPNSRPDRLKSIQSLNTVNSSCMSKNFLKLNYNDKNNSSVSRELSYLHDQERKSKTDTRQNNSTYPNRPFLIELGSRQNIDNIASEKNIEKDTCLVGDISSSISKPNSHPDRLTTIQSSNTENPSFDSQNFLKLNYNKNNSPVSRELSYLHNQERECKIDTAQNNSVYLSRPAFTEFGLEKNIESICSDRNIEKVSCFAGDISSSITKPDRGKTMQTSNTQNSSRISETILNLNYSDENSSPVSSGLPYLHDQERESKTDITQNNSSSTSKHNSHSDTHSVSCKLSYLNNQERESTTGINDNSIYFDANSKNADLISDSHSFNSYHQEIETAYSNKARNIFTFENEAEVQNNDRNFWENLKLTKTSVNKMNKRKVQNITNITRVENITFDVSSNGSVPNENIPKTPYQYSSTNIPSSSLKKLRSHSNDSDLHFENLENTTHPRQSPLLNICSYNEFLTEINIKKSNSDLDPDKEKPIKTSTPIPFLHENYDTHRNTEVCNRLDDSVLIQNNDEIPDKEASSNESFPFERETYSSDFFISDDEEMDSLSQNVQNITLQDIPSSLLHNFVEKSNSLKEVNSELKESPNETSGVLLVSSKTLSNKTSQSSQEHTLQQITSKNFTHENCPEFNYAESPCENTRKKYDSTTESIVKENTKLNDISQKPVSDCMSHANDQKETEILFSSLDSTIKLSYGQNSNDSTMKLNIESESSTRNNENSETNSMQPKQKRKLIKKQEKNDYGVKRLKLSRCFSKYPTELETIAVARRGKDGKFKMKLDEKFKTKLPLNDPVDEIVNKYLPSSSNNFQ